MNNTRKTLPRAALSRLYWIDGRIASGRYPNVPSLIRDYAEVSRGEEVSESTIYRDISYMIYELHAPIAYDRARKGYYYRSKVYRLRAPDSFTSADGLLALGMTRTLLELYRETPLYESATELLDTMTAPLGGGTGARNAWWEERIVVPAPASARVAPAVWDAILAALKENRVLAFDYKGAWDEATHPRRVRPWQLLFDNGTWLLSGWSEERSAHRLFTLSGIDRVKLTREKFLLPVDFDYSTRNAGSFSPPLRHGPGWKPFCAALTP
jgi:predicted DNA-binding transcriptional regulator YafY